MKSEDRSGDQFAAGAVLIENKATRLDDVNKANKEQALRFARTDAQQRAIQLEALKAFLRNLEARDREAGEVSPDETGEGTPDENVTPDNEDARCSD